MTPLGASPRLLLVVGTRPEAIKMAPVAMALKRLGGNTTRLLLSAQHRGLLDEVLREFSLTADYDLDLMRENQTQGHIVSAVMEGVEPIVGDFDPHWVVVQGDTTTAFAAALSAFYSGVPVAHVEAGLRTGRLDNPFPEEANRVLISRLASCHFAPTEAARDNLLREGVAECAILVTGNTVVDALRHISGRTPRRAQDPAGRPKTVVVTSHRRESFGPPLESICAGIRQAAQSLHPEVEFLVLVHPNPRVESTIRDTLSGLPGVRLLQPMGYSEFVRLIRDAYAVVTDSGGLQEEAPALDVPVLVLRDTTERPELIESGAGELIGTDSSTIAERLIDLVRTPERHRAMSLAPNPFGDGQAAERIAGRLLGVAVQPFRSSVREGT